MSSNAASTPTRAPAPQRPVASLPSQAARPSAASASAALIAARKRNAADALLVPGATAGGAAGSNSAKRARPTSRALPPSIVRHVPESAVYGDLCRIERSLDWTVARKRAEVSESISKTPKVSSGVGSLSLRQRVHLPSVQSHPTHFSHALPSTCDRSSAFCASFFPTRAPISLSSGPVPNAKARVKFPARRHPRVQRRKSLKMVRQRMRQQVTEQASLQTVRAPVPVPICRRGPCASKADW